MLMSQSFYKNQGKSIDEFKRFSRNITGLHLLSHSSYALIMAVLE